MPSLAALYLGYNSAGKGTYTVGGASSLSAASEYLGYAGTGSLAQSAGTNAVSGTLYLGYNSTANSTYALSGTGQLTAAGEYVGYNSAATVSFQQTGGANTVTNLTIGAGDQYLLSGGTLTINGSLINKGTVNGGNGSATLGANCLVDLTSGTWKNYSDWSVNIGTTGLVIVPAGFNVATGFAGVTTAGLNVHVTGTPLTVPAGDGFTGVGTIGDPIANQGTITVASGSALNFTGGLNVSGSGSASLGTGNLTVNNASSGMSGTTLSAANLYVGSGGTGTFTHSAGTNSLSSSLYLGYNSADTGTYALSGTGKLSVSAGSLTGNQYIGYSGTGNFTQSGGTNNLAVNLYLGYNSTAVGTYNLSGGALNSTPAYNPTAAYVGYSGAGSVVQSGGSADFMNVYLGYNTGVGGTYNMTGGTIANSWQYLGWNGTGNFTQSGGSNNSYTLYLGYNSGASGAYSLSGTAVLSAASEYIGYNSTATASLQQTGGSNSVSALSIGSGDQYLMSGGTLNITNNITNSGTVDGGNGSVTVSANCLLDLTSGTWKNYSDWTINTGTNGLLVVPAGFNVSTGLAGVTTAGLGVHVLGTTLNVPAGTGFSGIGTISDLVVCQGTIAASNTTTNNWINLTNGLILSGSGSVNLVNGSLTVNDAASGISGGTLTATNQYVGSGGTGTFTHSAGTSTLTSLYLGYNSTDTGTYALERHGQADRER